MADSLHTRRPKSLFLRDLSVQPTPFRWVKPVMDETVPGVNRCLLRMVARGGSVEKAMKLQSWTLEEDFARGI